MLTGGGQSIAVGILGASVISSLLNSAQRFSFALADAGVLTARLIGLAVWLLLDHVVPWARAGRPETIS